jgi:hypothetical protein
MPKSCNSISKIISISFVVFLSSCASISQLTFSEQLFVGKLSFTDTKSQSSFKVSVQAFSEKTIIQIDKPLFGNLLKIEFDYLEGFSFNPRVDKRYLSLLRRFKKKDYINFFNKCFSNYHTAVKIFNLKKEDIELKCTFRNEDAVFVDFIFGNEININGVLKRG